MRRAGCSGCGAGGGGGCGRPRCSCGSGSSPRTSPLESPAPEAPQTQSRFPGSQSGDVNPKNTSPFNRSCCVTPGKKKGGGGVTSAGKRGKTQDSTTNLLRKLGQLLRLPLPIPTYHGANEGRKSGAGEGGCTSAGAVTAEVPPLLLLLTRYLRCALSLSRRPTTSNGTADTRLPAPLP